MSKKSKKKDHVSTLKRQRIKKLLDIALTFHRNRQVQLAEEAYRKIIEYDPLHFKALYLLGILASEVGNYDNAIGFLVLALRVKPDYAMAHNDLGVIFQQKGDTAKAMECFRRALELNGSFHEAENNLGVAYQAKGEHKKAAEHFKKAKIINPYYFDACNNYIFALDMAEDSTVEMLIDARREWSKIHEEPLLKKQKPHTNSLSKTRKLRVGYVSADMRLHSASFVFGSVLDYYDKSKFEVYAYNNYVGKSDSRLEHFKKCVTVWRDVYGISDDDLAGIIRRDEIDILVDLSGFSAGSRLLTFARKPAPIQVTAWGYATSTGMKSMDYFFADDVVVPPEEKGLYIEEVVDLPCLVNHYCPEPKPDVKELPALKNGYITFGNFNRMGKVSDTTFAAWAKVILSVPNSKLLFKINEEDITASIERISLIFEGNGVGRDRLRFLGKGPWVEHMEAFNEVDIALDPWPHTGGLTTIDNLCMGVPVISLRWPTIVGRLSASMLHTMGMDDWIAETEEEYLALAVEKAKDIQGLSEVRNGLQNKFYANILGDSESYCREVEEKYLWMWGKYIDSKAV